MNQITAAGAASTQLGWIPGVVTAIFIVFFAGWVMSLFRASNRPTLDAAARMPLED